MDTEIIKTDPVQESPAKSLQYGKKASKALVGVVKQNGWSVRIQNRDYLVYEAWQTLAKFYNCTVKTISTEQIIIGEVTGFKAKSAVIDSRGVEIGGAEALCMSDEKNWSGKPLFSLMSMAQTRAGAKALRQIFSYVVVLAGYEATPKEEMDGVIISPSPSQAPREEAPKLATDKQKALINDFMNQGRLEDTIDPDKLSIKEASALIERGFKTQPQFPSDRTAEDHQG